MDLPKDELVWRRASGVMCWNVHSICVIRMTFVQYALCKSAIVCNQRVSGGRDA